LALGDIFANESSGVLMKFRIPAAAIALSAALVMTGCAVTFDPGKGATTIAESTQASIEKDFPVGSATNKRVLMKLGPPSEKSKEAGYEVWQYKYVKNTSVSVMFVNKPMESKKTAVFYFNEATGVLEKADFKEE
jgi:hypothetical protein